MAYWQSKVLFRSASVRFLRVVGIDIRRPSAAADTPREIGEISAKTLAAAGIREKVALDLNSAGSTHLR
jgi:hypothetical protein